MIRANAFAEREVGLPLRSFWHLPGLALPLQEQTSPQGLCSCWPKERNNAPPQKKICSCVYCMRTTGLTGPPWPASHRGSRVSLGGSAHGPASCAHSSPGDRAHGSAPKGLQRKEGFLLRSLAVLRSLLLFHLLLSSLCSSSVRLTRYIECKSPGCPGPFNHPSVSSIVQPDMFHSMCSARLNFLLHPHLTPRISLTFESLVLQSEPFPDPSSSQQREVLLLCCARTKGGWQQQDALGIPFANKTRAGRWETLLPTGTGPSLPVPLLSWLLLGPVPFSPCLPVPVPLPISFSRPLHLRIPHASVRSVSSLPTRSKITAGSHYLGKPRENQHRAAAFNEPFYNSEPACAALPQPPSVHPSQMAPVGHKTGVSAEGHGVPGENRQR